MSNDNGKTLLKSIVAEDPLQFKTDFNAIINQKVMDKIQERETDIMDEVNAQMEKNIKLMHGEETKIVDDFKKSDGE
jgi:hypothetical protein